MLRPTRRAVLAGAGAIAACGGPAFSASMKLEPGFHRGIGYAHLHVPGYGYGSAASAEQLQLLARLGVTHVALMPFAYLPALDAPQLRVGGDPTLDHEALVREGQAIRARGMVPVLKPHLWSRAFSDGKFAGDIAMRTAADWEAFFRNYTGWIRTLSATAAAMGAELFILGTELSRASKENPGAWGQVAAAARERYGGAVTYAANWYGEFAAFTDWSALDYAGVNAYYPLAEAPDPTLEQLVQGWRSVADEVGRVAAASGKSVLFTEVGCPAIRGAARTPWQADGAPDPELQARVFEAMFQALSGYPWWRGIYVWKWFTGGADNAWDRSPFCPQGQPAEAVLGRWFHA